MPKALRGHAMITLNMDLIVIGGDADWPRFSSTLYRFRCQGVCHWHKMNQKLKNPRSYFVAMIIPDKLVRNICQ